MSDYMFMLESHLTAVQHRALVAIQQAAADARVNLYLTGGAVRDMLGRFPIRDLDFTVEGNALALARTIAESTGAEILHTDDTRKRTSLQFPGDVTVEIGMAREESYPKPGGRPQVTPAAIHQDLHNRDFSINALALSLNRGSRGLILDPENGAADLERRELRAVSNYGFYNDPVRLLRLIRYRVRLGFTVAERTQRQYENAREAGMEDKISRRALTSELRQLALESNPGEILHQLEHEKLLIVYSSDLTGEKLNLAGFTKLSKIRQTIPFGVDLHTDELALFLCLLTEHLGAKEKTSLMNRLALTDQEVEHWQKLPARAKRQEKALTDRGLQRPSKLFDAVLAAPGEQVLYLLLHSTQRLLHDRLRNFLTKYWPLAQEVTPQDVIDTGVSPGTPAYDKKRKDLISARLNSRPKKVAPPEDPPIAIATAARR